MLVLIEVPTGNTYYLLTVCLQISCWALYMYYFILIKANSTLVSILQIENLRFRLRFCLKLYNFMWENLDSNPSLSLKLHALNCYTELITKGKMFISILVKHGPLCLVKSKVSVSSFEITKYLVFSASLNYSCINISDSDMICDINFIRYKFIFWDLLC